MEHVHEHKERSEKEQKELLTRLRRIEGQIRGIEKMVENDAYCPDILIQVSAVTNALNSFNKELLACHIRSCVSEDIKSGNLKKVYLLYGEESWLRRQYLNRLLNAVGAKTGDMNYTLFTDKKTGDEEVIQMCETLPFFAERRTVLLDDTGLFKAKHEKLADYIKNLPYLCCFDLQTYMIQINWSKIQSRNFHIPALPDLL